MTTKFIYANFLDKKEIKVKKLPIYEYKCDDCGQIFDVLQKINSDPVKECIHCGGNVEKMISASSFQFKGSGWYVTDYKKTKSDKDKYKNPEASVKGTGKDNKNKDKEKQKNVA